MQTTPIPLDARAEAVRLQILRRYHFATEARDAALDRIVFTAAQVFRVPIALLTLVGESRQIVAAGVGPIQRDISRDAAFCTHTIRSNEVMVVEDAGADVRFAKNPLVLQEPFIRFYAGAPLVAPAGARLGSLCVIDHAPRELRPQDIVMLRKLAVDAMEILEDSRQRRAETAAVSTWPRSTGG